MFHWNNLLLLLCFCVPALHGQDVLKAEIEASGKVGTTVKSPEKTGPIENENKEASSQMESLTTKINQLQSIAEQQQRMIHKMNESLLQLAYIGEQYNTAYQSTVEPTLGVLSSVDAHSQPFTMIHVSAVKLPDRDTLSLQISASLPAKKKKNKINTKFKTLISTEHNFFFL
ncbi:hypothetical protein RFI_01942 [Reticulomyxa filosa]|uniref:Uncharacterized protein n=1 Tax=Reticulomyxa filosa TaxID=46433 RepID=X6PBT0_RETFI|nr:hypothetical protein RFI_01942 [Reticulomyxa filosa]|eukprot:ETO35132.1 hypothetical protein RFI_01942 [Reticulomyxa filosa]